MQNITSPQEFFGVTPGTDGTILRWDKIVEYFYLLEKESGKIKVTDMGPSTEGNPFLQVVITSERNMENLEKYRKISMALADPRALSENVIANYVKTGKAVCVQSMSLHASEIGGTQMSVLLAHDLISSVGAEEKNILDEVIFVMIPCFNPDGEIMVADWYNKYKGTKDDGASLPVLYHKYSGHDNNRDAFAQNLIESRYMGQTLFHQWMPQSFQDHHHMGSYGARLFVAPYKEPVRPYTDPLIWRELSSYGSAMAYKCEEEGLEGVANSTQFPGWGHYGYHWLTNSHNIVGMLSESASARLASPLYIHKDQLRGDGDIPMPTYEQRSYFPSPWQGGWWKLSDIVRQQFVIAKAQLDFMAKNRRQILKNMANKALRQAKRGEESGIGAFIISASQFDLATMYKLIDILLGQGVEVRQAIGSVTVNGITYPQGSFIVPLAQPKYGLIMNLLSSYRYPDNEFTRNQEGAPVAFDAAADTVAEYMGVSCVPANGKIEGRMRSVKEAPTMHSEITASKGYVISGKENNNYKIANKLMAAGFKVFRMDECPVLDFYVEGDFEKLAPILSGSKVRMVDTAPKALTRIKPAKVMVYQRYNGGNADEGWLRLVLENFEFPYKTVMDKDIIGGALSKCDVLILPSDMKEMLIGPHNVKNPSPMLQRMKSWIGTPPQGFESGLGDEGAKAIADFVRDGGTLLAVNKSSSYAIDILNLGVQDLTQGLTPAKFCTHGSTLNVNYDTKKKTAYAMPKQGLAVHWDGPVFSVTEVKEASKYTPIATYAETDVLKSGLLNGEKVIAGKIAVLSAQVGDGEVILYGFQPTLRAQTHGTFKLIFNMLYK